MSSHILSTLSVCILTTLSTFGIEVSGNYSELKIKCMTIFVSLEIILQARETFDSIIVSV